MGTVISIEARYSTESCQHSIRPLGDDSASRTNISYLLTIETCPLPSSKQIKSELTALFIGSGNPNP